jgi:hypothetical protein
MHGHKRIYADEAKKIGVRVENTAETLGEREVCPAGNSLIKKR